MKRTLSALLMLVLFMTALPASALEADAQPLPVGTIVGDGVILYGNPVTTSPHVGMLSNGKQVLAVRQTPDWVQVYALEDGQVGWVTTSQVSFAAPAAFSSATAYFPAIVISKSISLRVEPNVRSERITTLPNATLLNVLEDQGHWLYVYAWSLEEKAYVQGWLKSDFVVRNPRFVTTHKATFVYAIPDRGGKKVGEVISGTQLVIIGEYGNYWVVNLRSASGFIHKSDILYID